MDESKKSVMPLPEDSAILMINPSEAYRVVSLLPEEMILYELETQGMRAKNSLNMNSTQLANLFKQGKYKRNRQPVAMGFQEDFSYCVEYFQKWKAELADPQLPSLAGKQYVSRLRFLLRRYVFACRGSLCSWNAVQSSRGNLCPVKGSFRQRK